MNIDKASLAVEIDGKVYLAAIKKERLQVLLKMAASLSDNGKLNVIPAPEGCKFTTIEDA